MELANFFWWIIFSIPILGLGIAFAFCPQKMIQIRAKIELNTFYSLHYSDEDIDKLRIQSMLFGEGYSKRLKDQLERPHEFRSLMIWVRIMGFILLSIYFISTWLLLLAIRTGNLTVR
jgi:hypothetical protein